MRKTIAKRGMTLAETLLAVSVLGVVLALAFATIVPAIRINKDAEESIAAQRQVVLAFDRLMAEMSTLNRATVSSAPGCLSFVSTQPYRGTNAVIDSSHWDDLLHTTDRAGRKTVFLRHRDNNLWRQEYPYQFGRDGHRILGADLTVLADRPGMQEKIFTKNVEGFEVGIAGRSRVYLQIRCVFRESKRPAACELHFQTQMRGGL